MTRWTRLELNTLEQTLSLLNLRVCSFIGILMVLYEIILHLRYMRSSVLFVHMWDYFL